MIPNRVTFAALALTSVVAAGAGGYFAIRQNAVPTPAAAAPSIESVPEATGTERAVQETEAVVAEPSPARAADLRGAADARGTVAPTARPASPRRVEAAAKPARARPAGASAVQQDLPALERSWPTGAAAPSAAPAPPATPTADGAAAAHIDEPAAQNSVRAPEPPVKMFEELVVPPSSVLGLETETRLSSDTAKVEDRVEARVTRDVKVGDKVAIPAGSRALGVVTQVDPGGKFKQRARIGIRFNTLVLADATRLPISTETIVREGEAPGNAAAAKVGGAAVGGAILGAIIGGAKGAAIGATAGAGGGVAVVEAGDASALTLPAGSRFSVRLLTPVTVTVEQK